MVDDGGNTGADRGDSENGSQFGLIPWRPETQPEVLPVAEAASIEAVQARLVLDARGHLDASAAAALKRFVAGRGTRGGYGFVYNYEDGELCVGLERECLSANAMGADPAGKFERDLRELLACLPESLEIRLEADLTVISTSKKTMYGFRLGQGYGITREVTVGTADAAGSTSASRKLPVWDNPCFTVPAIIILGAIIALLVHLGFLRL